MQEENGDKEEVTLRELIIRRESIAIILGFTALVLLSVMQTQKVVIF